MYAKMGNFRVAEKSCSSRKRKEREQSKIQEKERRRIRRNYLPLDQLNTDLLEQVLSWLPTSNFFRVTSVCKRWKSVADSATFRHACSRVPSRDPSYFMADSQSFFNTQPIVFDTAENTWKMMNSSCTPSYKGLNFVPVAASGGLICFRSAENQFIVSNPVTGASRQIASCNDNNNTSEFQQTKPLRAIGMISRSESYKLVLVSGETSELSFKIYNSKSNQWEEETNLVRKTDITPPPTPPAPESDATEDENAVYFLSKCGNVVSTDLQRNPCKQYSSVTTIQKNGEEIMYFLSSSGRVISCNLTAKSYTEYPRLLPPVYHEYSVDLIECGGGEVSAVVLSEFLESASLRIWRFDERGKFWYQIGAMSPAMSHEFYGKKVDINCSANGKKILICCNSVEICRYFLYDLVDDKWIELPDCHLNGELREFSCGFSFEPRIEASV